MYLCVCKGVRATEAEAKIRSGSTAQSLVRELGLDDLECCGLCQREIDKLVSAMAKGSSSS